MLSRAWFPALSLVGALGCAPEAAPIPHDPPVRVAVAGPMSGESAFQGQAMVEAAQLAAAQVNAAGGLAGRRVEIEGFDDAAAPPAEVAAAIVASDAVAVLGHRTSSACLAAAPVYAGAGLAAITASATDPAVTRDGPTFYRWIYDNDDQGAFLAAYARGGLHADAVGLVDAGQSLAPAFRAGAADVGLPIAAEVAFDPKAPDLAPVVAAIQACDACDVIVLATPELAARDAIVALRDAGIPTPILAGQAVGREGFGALFADLPKEKEQPGFYTDGLFAASAALPDSSGPAMQAFQQAYEDRFGRLPDTSAAVYYDAARLALDAAAARPDRAGVLAALAARGSPATAWAGTSGRAWFDARRTAARDVPVATFARGTLISAPRQLARIRDPGRERDARVADGTWLALGGAVYAPVQVAYAGVDVVEIADVDFSAGTFVADAYVWVRYVGDLDLDGVELSTAAEPGPLGEPMWRRTRDGWTTATWRVRTTHRGAFEFHDYPFDRQQLRVALRPTRATSDRLVLALDRLALGAVDGSGAILGDGGSLRLVDLSTTQDDVAIHSSLGEVGLDPGARGLRFSRVAAVATIERDVFAYALRAVVPLGIVLVLLYGSWFLPHTELGTRTTITITAVLTVSVLHQQLADQLPGVGYLVAMDFAYYLALAVSLLATFASGAVFLLDRAGHARAAMWTDRAGQVLTPLLVGALLLAAWARFG